MENKSPNVKMALGDANNVKLLSNPGDLDTDLVKQGMKKLPLLLNSQMFDRECKNNSDIQDSYINFSLSKKKRKKKMINGDLLVWHDDAHLKTDSSILEMPATINAESMPSTDRTELTENALKQEQKRIILKETPMNKLLNSQMLADSNSKDTFAIQDLDFNMLKKKRKKKVGNDDLFDDDIHLKTNSYDLHRNTGDADYGYEDLLNRIYSIISAKDSKSKSDNQKSVIMRPPQVIRIGARKTSFTNFLDICKTLHRSPQHLHSYILAELATSASIDSNNQLIIRGRFEQKQIETVLRRYIKEYVTCHACHSFDTMLQKDSRLCFLHCESCGSRWSVASIKSGFQAVTSKRAAIRAKVN